MAQAFRGQPRVTQWFRLSPVPLPRDRPYRGEASPPFTLAPKWAAKLFGGGWLLVVGPCRRRMIFCVWCCLVGVYCIRHTYGLWDHRQPRALMSDAEAVNQLVSHRYFQSRVTPIQVFNRATDPFLAAVRPHTFAAV